LPINYTRDHDTVLRRPVESAQEANIKLRLLAEQLLSDFRALNYEDTLPARPMFDQLLLTVQNRVRRDAPSTPS
jgi:hypothetical protein